MTLFSALSNLEDSRRAQGRRTNLTQLLTITILSYLCGCTLQIPRRIFSILLVPET